MAKNSGCAQGVWMLLAAIVFGSCMVAAAVIVTLPKYFPPSSSANPKDTLPSLASLPRTPTPASVTVRRPLTSIGEAFVEDKFEGQSPDFRRLIVSHDDETVYVTLNFNSGISIIGESDLIYLSGTHNDIIRLGPKFTLERDCDGDGGFDQIVFSGSIKKIASDTISMEIPIEHLPDIAGKEVWAYSERSKDRIPDQGALRLPPASQSTMPMPSPSPGSAQSPKLTGEASVEDKFEGKNPDFRALSVSYDDKTVYVTLFFNAGMNRVGGADFVYLYGTHHDLIRLGGQSFRIERDGGADGHFEQRVYSGSVVKMDGGTISMEIPLEYLPDIAEKRVWGYSMQSKDRIPDDGALLMPLISLTPVP